MGNPHRSGLGISVDRKDSESKQLEVKARGVLVLGCSAIVGLLWANEIFDLPHVLFGAAPTPVNLVEAGLETALVVVVAVSCVFILRRGMRYVRYLEELTVICSGCHQVRVDRSWIPLEQWVGERMQIVLSHGLCEDCLRRLYPQQYAAIIKTQSETSAQTTAKEREAEKGGGGRSV